MRKLLTIPFLCATLLVGCSESQVPFVHRMDVPQGNVVTKDMLDKLEPGLNKRQVRYVMGSPMLIDVFNQEEWIYLYSFEPGGGERVQRRVSLFFKDDRLVQVSGDARLTDEETPLAVRSAEGVSRSVEVPPGVGAGYEDGGILQGVIDRFKGLNPWSDDDQPRRPQDEPEAAETAAEAEPEGRETMQKFSLGSGDVSAGKEAPDAPAEADTPAASDDSGTAEKAGESSAREQEGFFGRLKRSIGLGDDEPATGTGQD